MHLTREEERMLAGEYGYALKKSMEILVALGEIYRAEKMIEIRSAQVSGVSYKSLGEEGLEFIEELAEDGRVRVETTLNPCGMDLKNWRDHGVPEDFAEKQLRVIEAYKKLGIKPTLTCTPYLAGNKPRFGDHIAWSESSAIIYANSVLGARTNREGGPSALAAAIAGRTPYYGLHLDENRIPEIEVNAPRINGSYKHAALGFLIGERVGDRIPLIKGLMASSEDELKALGAALACSGGVALFHIDGITPEARSLEMRAEERIVIEEGELEEAINKLNDESIDPDLVFIGCPHASIRELIIFMEQLRGRKAKKRTWIYTSREVKELAERMGVSKKLRECGVEIVADTCPIVSPIRRMGIRSIATNSAKGAWFSRNLNKLKIRFMPIEKLVEEATR